jgi:CheY-like chemotaxis protein
MKKILLVDDMEEVHEKFRQNYKGCYELLHARTEEEALRMACREEGNLGLMITDVNLDLTSPEQAHGIRLIELLSQERRYPIVGMSKGNYEQQAIVAGATEFAFKRELLTDPAKYIKRYMEVENGKRS